MELNGNDVVQLKFWGKMESVPFIAFYSKKRRNLSAKALVGCALPVSVSAATKWPFWKWHLSAGQQEKQLIILEYQWLLIFFLKTVLRYKSQIPMLLTSSLGPLCTSTSSGPDTCFGGVPWVLFFDYIFKLFFVHIKDIYFCMLFTTQFTKLNYL